MTGEALYYGMNTLTNNMILADRKKLRTPNGVILGTPGSGKSFSAKREITGSFLQTSDDIIKTLMRTLKRLRAIGNSSATPVSSLTKNCRLPVQLQEEWEPEWLQGLQLHLWHLQLPCG